MRILLVAAVSLTTALPALAREVSHRVSKAVSAAGVKRVVIDIPAGEFTIRNGARNRITVDGVVRRDYDAGEDREEIQAIVDDTGIGIEVRAGEATIYRTFGPNARGWRARHATPEETRIDVPAGMDVTVAARFGELRMDGSFGDVDIDMRAGEIHLRMPRSDVRVLDASCTVGEVHTNVGDRIVTREGLFPGHTHFINDGGRTDVRVHVTAGEVHVTLTK
jgi:hypothetical protein